MGIMMVSFLVTFLIVLYSLSIVNGKQKKCLTMYRCPEIYEIQSFVPDFVISFSLNIKAYVRFCVATIFPIVQHLMLYKIYSFHIDTYLCTFHNIYLLQYELNERIFGDYQQYVRMEESIFRLFRQLYTLGSEQWGLIFSSLYFK